MQENQNMSMFTDLLRNIKRKPTSCSAVIAAAGNSQRMGGSDKLFHNLCGIPVLAHTLIAFQKCDLISEIVVVTREESLADVTKLCDKYGINKVTKVIAGGGTRLESVMNGVLAVSKKAELIAIHDGARPCIDDAIIKKTIVAAEEHHAAAPGVPVVSTLKKVFCNRIFETVNREEFVEIQTPQIFTSDVIKGALTNAIKGSLNITDDCMAVEALGVLTYVTEGSRSNIKITTKEDLKIAEVILMGK